jgi:hypothetical protein
MDLTAGGYENLAIIKFSIRFKAIFRHFRLQIFLALYMLTSA